MALEGKLELLIKINALPSEVKTDKNGWKQFVVVCSGREISMTVRPKLYTRLTDAAAKWPLWVASIEGKMGKATPKGFVLEEPNVQVFERKPKDKPEGADAPAAGAPAPAQELAMGAVPPPAEAPAVAVVAQPPAAEATALAPAAAAPVAAAEPKTPAASAAEKAPASQRSSVFALEQQVRAALLSALEKGLLLEPMCTRHGLPWRRVQELVEQKDSPLTEPQKHTLLTKLLSALRAETASGAS